MCGCVSLRPYLYHYLFGRNDLRKTATIGFTISCRRHRIATPKGRHLRQACTLCIFVSLLFEPSFGNTTLKDRRGPFLKDQELTRIRNANKTAVPVAIKRGTAHRCTRVTSPSQPDGMRPCRGRPPSGPGAARTRRDPGARSLPPSGWLTLGRGGGAGRPRRRQPRPGTTGSATVRRSFPFFSPSLTSVFKACYFSIGCRAYFPRVALHSGFL